MFFKFVTEDVKYNFHNFQYNDYDGIHYCSVCNTKCIIGNYNGNIFILDINYKNISKFTCNEMIIKGII